MTGPHPFVMSENTEILGEIVAWNWEAQAFSYHDFVSALEDAGFSASLAREKLPKNAFASAAKKLSRERIIRKLREDETDIVFQFTKEHNGGDQFDYEKETLVTLSKTTGAVYSEIPELSKQTEELISEAMGKRTSSDVAYVLKKLFHEKADLFAIRQAGGVYFVPVQYAEFLDRVDIFLQGLGCSLTRLPVAKGTTQGDKSVKETIESGIQSMIEEHFEAIDKLSGGNRDATFEKRAEKIKLTRFKIESYACYLGAEQERLLEELDRAQESLRTKVEEISVLERRLETVS